MADFPKTESWQVILLRGGQPWLYEKHVAFKTTEEAHERGLRWVQDMQQLMPDALSYKIVNSCLLREKRAPKK